MASKSKTGLCAPRRLRSRGRLLGGATFAFIAGWTGILTLPAAAADSTVNAIETVVVTAEKRSENLQTVPVSVNALTADGAARRGITGTLDLSAAVPGLVINNPANVGNPFLRGVGSNLFDPSSEQSVAMYVDGVYIAAPESNLFQFNNIDRIEVLKGPQGTLFGRNATGGVIQIITKDPTQTTSADLSIGYANYDDVSASFYGTTGITDNLAVDFAALYENQGTGYGRNLTTGKETFQQAIGNVSFRSKVLFTPDDATTIRLAVDFAHLVSTPSYQKPPGAFSPIDGSTYPGRYNTFGSIDDRNRVNTGGASLQIDHDFGFANLVSITAYRKTQVRYSLDDDVTKIVAADIILVPNAHNWSEELRLAGPSEGWLKWMVGGYYYGATGAYAPVFIDGAPQVADRQTTVSYAGFGQATTEVFSDTNLTLGLRYTSEKQSYALTVPVALSLNQKFDKLTYRVALDHQFADNIFGYISYNRGFKSGGFNLLAPGNAFKPETLDSTEIGLKTEWFDNRLRLNVDAFLYQYQNIQLALPVFGGLIVTNAAAAHLQGVEADFEAVPIDNLTLTGGLAYLDGHYSNYPGAVPLDKNGVAGAPINEAGFTTVMSPKITGSLTADYRIPSPVGDFHPALSLVYNDGFFWQSDNRLVQPAYTLLNASIGWTSTDGMWEGRLWTKNLTDATYYIARISVGGVGDVQEQAAPRTFGITLGVHL